MFKRFKCKTGICFFNCNIHNLFDLRITITFGILSGIKLKNYGRNDRIRYDQFHEEQ